MLLLTVKHIFIFFPYLSSMFLHGSGAMVIFTVSFLGFRSHLSFFCVSTNLFYFLQEDCCNGSWGCCFFVIFLQCLFLVFKHYPGLIHPQLILMRGEIFIKVLTFENTHWLCRLFCFLCLLIQGTRGKPFQGKTSKTCQEKMGSYSLFNIREFFGSVPTFPPTGI